MTEETQPLSGKGKPIVYCKFAGDVAVRWGETTLNFPERVLKDVLNNFFVYPDRWYELGASMTSPIRGGLGEYLREHHNLTARLASVVAAILKHEGYIRHRGKKPIELQKIAGDQSR